MNWLRLYTDALHKRKVQNLPGELFKAWINLLLIARQNNGILLPLPEIAFQLHVEPETAAAWVTALIDRKLFDQTAAGVIPHDWDEYQYDSDDAAKRMREHRARKRRSERRSERVTSPLRTRAEQNRIILPNGNTEKPAAEKSDIERAKNGIATFPGAKNLPGSPDLALAEKCLEMAGGSIVELERGLRALDITGKRPSISWGWFPKVLETYLRPARRPVDREQSA